ncbi:hypothetical protein BSPWISOXPB_4451 [uncultured Gammaproteobacteria bacterium]|nr:hypothetical protein BSPWISOXPB_4451 [uncultured Gammaproteobacteria bacterium]
MGGNRYDEARQLLYGRRSRKSRVLNLYLYLLLCAQPQIVILVKYLVIKHHDLLMKNNTLSIVAICLSIGTIAGTIGVHKYAKLNDELVVQQAKER